GHKVPQAITRAIQELEKLGAGEGRINFRLRDAAFGRQRYWGEPIPIYYQDGIPYPLPESELPLKLPEVDKFLPTEDGEPPLARAANWSYNGFPLETTTMPGWAGSSWYFLRYMDPKNEGRFASPEAINYWQQVDLYVGGSEHATGHLLYFRFWTKFLFDHGYINFDEPAKKLVNQGMIQGVSAIAGVFKVRVVPGQESLSGTTGFKLVSRFEQEEVEVLSSLNWHKNEDQSTLHGVVVERTPTRSLTVPIDYVDGNTVEIGRLKELANVDGRFSFLKDQDYLNIAPIVGSAAHHIAVRREVDKMSKSKHNVVNPDRIIEEYGADTLRLYEMFLGPLEQSKPWDTNGIEGTFRFLRKFWNLFHLSAEASAKADGAGEAFGVSDDAPTKPELKVLHATLKKVTEDIEKMSFNTSVAQFMIAVNELGSLKCNKRAVLEPLVIALAPFAPHIAEELWEKLGHPTSVTTAPWPQWSAEHLVEDSFSYPISFNGKTRLQLEFPITLSKEEVEAAVLANPEVQAKLGGQAPKKVIVVPKRIVNIVV
ncbi:MAG TPA: class I tRNA ligase family protein, partial [Flavobacteriales bacterium]|nr:class I tRNA ligase family protein [Flavobacteriales bacterium]